MLQREMNLQLGELALFELYSVRPTVLLFFFFNLTQLQEQSPSLCSCQKKDVQVVLRSEENLAALGKLRNLLCSLS